MVTAAYSHSSLNIERQIPPFDPEALARLSHEWFGVQGDVKILHSELDLTALVQAEKPTKNIVIKIGSVLSGNQHAQMQIAALRHLADTAPEVAIPRVINTLNGETCTYVTDESGQEYMMWAMTCIEGELLEYVPCGARQGQLIRYSMGEQVAQVSRGLHGFMHPEVTAHHVWEIERVGELEPFANHIKEPALRANVRQFIEFYQQEVAPRVRKVRHQAIHQDSHQGNVFIANKQATEVCGLIDFGDMVWGSYPADIAVAAECFPDDSCIIDRMCEVAIGYDRVLPLESNEADLILDLTLARLAITVTQAAARRVLQPELGEYVDNIEQYERDFQYLYQQDRKTVINRIRRALKFPVHFDDTAMEQ
uniref:phosphotransferase n=1 Tax=Vibrio sp. TaxID=678 RepID=UPI003D10FF27